MSLVERAKGILLNPKEEWPKIAKEESSISELYTGYACILAAFPLVGTLIASGLLSIGTGLGFGLNGLIGMVVASYLVGLGLLYVIGLIVNAVAPNFGGKSDMVATMKLLIYASTPTWVAGLVTPFIPFLGMLIGLAAVAYAIYLIFIGIRPVMGVADDKANGLGVMIVVIYFVVSFILTGIILAAIMSSIFGAAALTGALAG